MKQKELISVGLYLRGDNLDPKIVTKKLGVVPSDAQYRDEKKITSTQREYRTKIGLWALIAESESVKLSDLIKQVTAKVKLDAKALHNIEAVQEAYLDVFIARDSDEDGEGTTEFELSNDNISDIARLGLPVNFTVTFVKP
jgi:hypothetical protein